MQQTPWFERSFDFSGDPQLFPAMLERLEGTPLRLKRKTSRTSRHFLTQKVNGKWSIQEHVGHLIDLEPLWQGRLEDILKGETYLRPTDLANQATDEANHNANDLAWLVERFEEVRTETMGSLRSLSEADLLKSALHPRLEIPMRVLDLFLFVAEHDDHHLAAMTALSARNG